ncbi:hypothetical protein FOA52_002061 [Chlamydomonas sp. UWO 241]|nr:hypothetical protein FOA52_002061 [Chlamydomonas sp. UWO 241]
MMRMMRAPFTSATRPSRAEPRPLLGRKALRVMATTPEEAQSAATNAAQIARAKMGDAMGKIDVKNLPKSLPRINIKTDISSLVKYNFFVQAALTAVSWATVFFCTHSGMAQGHGVNVPTVLMCVAVLLSFGSTFLSFDYMRKVAKSGVEVLDGMKAMDSAFDHMKLNFLALALTLTAMQAEIGALFMSSASHATADYTAIAAMSQAGANLVLAHCVSLLFLTMIIRKISKSTKELVEWADQMRAGLMGTRT